MRHCPVVFQLEVYSDTGGLDGAACCPGADCGGQGSTLVPQKIC